MVGTIAGNHEPVKRQTFMEATVASTGMEESSIGLVAMRSFETVEQIERFFEVAGRGKQPHPLKKIMMLGLQAYRCVKSLKTE